MEALFCFSNGSFHVIELCFTSVPDTAPKSEKFQWILLSENQLTKLEFREMGKLADGRSLRRFQQGILIFGETEAYFNHVQNLQKVGTCPNQILEQVKALL
eukprot:TRINITY_DN1124_c0_g1_i1.p1 TRINITY_DN1124_c0_g1~~TRINITY_DN1124_c0_g1_i1.p1  ORF type:complete len:116 (-),score=38.32 TRINITY_DN1124_c0_g1_i1:141-443(-)